MKKCTDSSIRIISRLVIKDLRIELRRGELASMIVMGVIGLSLIISYGIWLAGVSEAQRTLLAPTLSLSILLMTALTVIGKFSEYDDDSGALNGLILAGISSDMLYLSRVLSLMIVVFITAVISCFTLPTLLGLPSAVLVGGTDGVAVCFLLAVGISATSALFGPIATRVRVGSIFLLTLLLPLVVPLFFAGCEVLAGNSASHDFWWTVLVSLDAIYLAAGLWLHSFIVK